MIRPSENPLRNLIREIHRRSLWQVLGIYIVGGWVAFEVVQTLTEGLGLPDWFPAFALVLLIIGLPIVIATAFVQEGGPEVSSADSVADLEDILSGSGSSDDEPSTLHRLFNWRNAVLGGVAAFVLLTTVALTWMSVAPGDLPSSLTGALNDVGNAGPGEQSVAVLPFANMSADPDNEYFSDGITEELLNALAQIPEMRVPGRTSSFAFKGQNLTIQQIADTLDVAHVLEGSVRRSGNRVLITAQLVDARTDTHLWSDTYERQLNDVFAIQREIAETVAGELRVTLSPEQEGTLARRGTRNPEAHEAYLRGRSLFNRRTAESLRAAISEFQRAIALDPEYAEAYSGLADSYSQIDSYSQQGIDYGENAEQAIEAARRAVNLAPTLAMGHASLGAALMNGGEWRRAERALETAIELGPAYAQARMWYGILLVYTGRPEEGLASLDVARDLDPQSHVVSFVIVHALWVGRGAEQAIQEARRTVRIDPNWPVGWGYLTAVLMDAGRDEEAIRAFVRSAQLRQVATDASAIEAELRALFRARDRWRQTGDPQPVPPVPTTGALFSFSWYPSYLTGQRDALLERFATLVGEGAYEQVAVMNGIVSDLLGDDPRYQALLDEAGITR